MESQPLRHEALARGEPAFLNRLQLAAEGAALVARLGGHWRDKQGMCLCPAHADHRPSLSVRVGHSALLFKCFAGCETADVIRAIRRFRLPLARGSGGTAQRGHDPPSETGRRAAERIWDLALPIRGTLAERYLIGRELPWPRADLRFHPRTPLGRGRAAMFRPALIAAVRERDRLVAIHRTFLDARTATLASDLANPRMMLGRPRGGAVRLAPATRRLGLAEGLETASAAITLLGLPVWAVLGSERLHQIIIPDEVEELILLPDNDHAGRRAERLARNSYSALPLSLDTQWPWDACKDWNDVLRRPELWEGRKRWERVRSAA